MFQMTLSDPYPQTTPIFAFSSPFISS